MQRPAQSWLMAIGLIAGTPDVGRADTVVTASGETIAGRETTVAEGTFGVPGAEGAAEKRLSLPDLQKITFAPGKPSGELKTRFVRVELPGAGKALSLAEVQVFEGEKEDKNVATEGKARQALSYQDDDVMWGAQKANDGKTGGDSRTDGVTRTNALQSPWWELELPRDAVIKKLVLWNRTDANAGPKLAGCRVQFLNERRQVLWTKTFDQAPNPKTEVETPVHSDKLSADDLKAIEKLGVVDSVPPLAAIVDAWIRGVKTADSAAKPAASSETVKAGRGGFAAQAPPAATAAPAANTASAFPDGEWLVRFEPGGFVVGKIKSWTDKGLTVEFPLDRDTKSITVPTAAIVEVTSKDIVLKKIALDRSLIAAEGDTVFAKAEGNALQAVTGTVKGIDSESLQFEFQGKVRSIKLARVASVVRSQPVSAATEKAYGVVELSNAMRLPGRVKSLADTAGVIELPWQENFDVRRASLKVMTVRNGRVISLTEIEPAKVAYTPFLDRVVPMRKNESLTGTPLQIGDKKFELGLCAHSGTTLTYDLAGGFDQLRLQIGLQKDDGARGQAVVRIKGDDAVLAEKPVAGTASEAIDVPLAGKKTLTIEIDYGDGLDVADHVVLGEPVLVRAAGP
jgi:hypothetical protein